MAERAGAVALVKAVGLTVDIDQRTGRWRIDGRRVGFSPADHAAVDVAARLAGKSDGPLVVLTFGGPAADPPLREVAAAAGATAVRLEPADGPASLDDWVDAYPSAEVARVLASAIGDAAFIVAGEHSLDRGSGAVPALVAAALGRPSALGLVGVDVAGRRAVRRLDGGFRQPVAFGVGAVLSVEASAGRLGRASPAALRAQTVEVRRCTAVAGPPVSPAPYRAPTRVVAAPVEPDAARRAMEVIGLGGATRARTVLEASPVEAADAILAQLAAWAQP